MALIPNSTANSLKDKQIAQTSLNITESIERMLNFNKSRDAKDTWDEPWKLLIYDNFSRDLISPLMRVGDLRKHGVTLHMLLHSDRQQIPDVPAIYFVSPTQENIKRIIEDFKHKLYDTYHLNFTSSIPRNFLEELANAALEYDVVSQVAKVYDQYLNFVSLEKDMFSLMQNKSFIGFNDPQITDTDAERNISTVVDALFSVLVTMGVVPIIRCPKSGAAAEVASQLDAKLQEHLNNVGNLFAEGSTSFQRPVLVLLERNIDVTVMVHHTWNYQPLAHDLLNMNLNKVSVEVNESEESSSKQMKQYDLDANTDSFWASNMDTPFPKIAVEVKAHLTEYQNAMEEFKKISGGADLETYDESQILGRTKELGAFVSNIPLLKEKKRLIDTHTNIAMTLLKEIKSRELDNYFSMEEDMISRLPQDKKEVLSILSDVKRGNLEDKLRLLLVYFLNNENLFNSSDLKEYMEILQSHGVDISPLTWAIKTKAFNKALSPVMTPQNNNNSSTLRGLMQKVNVDGLGFGTGISQQISTLLTAGVKALLPASKELYVTRIVDALMELKQDPSVDNYMYLDPKVQNKLRGKNMPRKSTPYKEAIVFVIGGGNYVEYQNLQEYAKKVPGKRIVYGSTELLNASQFISQIATLGAKYNQK